MWPIASGALVQARARVQGRELVGLPCLQATATRPHPPLPHLDPPPRTMVRAFMGFYGCARLCAGVRGCVRACVAVCGCGWVDLRVWVVGMRVWTGGCAGVRGCARVFR